MTTYYMRADGTASDVASATGPGTSTSDCMNITIHNAGSFSAGDIIKLCDDGGIFRGQITVPSSGDSDNQITYEPETGDSPKCYGSELATGWADQGSYRWRCDFGATTPESVWFSKSSVISWGNEESASSDVDAEYDWYYDGSQYLWVWSDHVSGPASVYDWIEGSIRDWIFVGSGKDYITVNDLEFAFGSRGGYLAVGGDYHIIDGVTSHHISKGKDIDGRAIYFQMSNNNITIKNCTLHNCGLQAIFALTAGGTQQNFIIESNETYDCYHSNIDFINNEGGTSSGHTIRYNLSYFTDDYDHTITPSSPYYLEGDNASDTVDDVDVYYNIAFKVCGPGFQLNQYCNNINLYNNVAYDVVGAQVSGGFLIGDNCSGIVLKNNIGADAGDECFRANDSDDISACDNNCWYQSAGGAAIYTKVDGSPYHYDDQAAYQSATTWDTNGKWEDPKFINTATNDFRPQPDSPCIDTGVDVSLTQDYAGQIVPKRSAPNMGAYESVEGYGELYNTFKEDVMEGVHDLVNDTIKVTLHTGYIPDIDGDEVWADVSSTEYPTSPGYIIGGKTLGSNAVTMDTTNDQGVFDAANVTWTSIGPLSPTAPSHAIIWNDTPTAPADPLIGYIDLGITVTNGGDYVLSWDTDGIVLLT